MATSRGLSPTELTIVNFHGIGQPARELEPGEGPFWLSRDQFCSILDRIVAHPERHRFAITFDDSNSSDLAIAVPELQKRKLVGTFFVLTGRFGSSGSLDQSDVQAIATSGMIIGSHGIDHRDMTRLSSVELDKELTQSRAVLESVQGKPVSVFSIPFGRYNAGVLRGIRKAGYTGAYTSDGGGTYMHDFLRPRRSMRQDMSISGIDQLLSGTAPLLTRLRRAAAKTAKQLL
jgi:peptidoglycan/xylan/chitin deacetylase (PgdA/CDA1 family)